MSIKSLFSLFHYINNTYCHRILKTNRKLLSELYKKEGQMVSSDTNFVSIYSRWAYVRGLLVIESIYLSVTFCIQAHIMQPHVVS